MGYPQEDVKGFIENEGKNCKWLRLLGKCTATNVKQGKTFHKFKKCELGLYPSVFGRKTGQKVDCSSVKQEISHTNLLIKRRTATKDGRVRILAVPFKKEVASEEKSGYTLTMQYTRRYLSYCKKEQTMKQIIHCKCITETAGIVIPGRDSFCGKAQPGRRKDNRQRAGAGCGGAVPVKMP